MRTRHWVMVLGGLLCTGAVVWHFSFGRWWTERIPPGWEWKAHYIGIQTFPDPVTGVLPEKDVTGVYERMIRIKSEEVHRRTVRLEDHYVIRNALSGKVEWEYVYAADVDPATGQHVTAPYRGEYFVFPRHVEKRQYVLRYSYMKGLPLDFEKEDWIDDVQTYVFSYRGRCEYTEAYAGTEEYAGVKVEPGQEISCADDQFFIRVWVEPVTGEAVKVEEGCYSADYVYEIATGKPVRPVLRWGGMTAGDDVIRRLEVVRSQRMHQLWEEWYFPAALLVAGLALLGAGALRVWRRTPALVEVQAR